jgi:hypothetical protein
MAARASELASAALGTLAARVWPKKSRNSGAPATPGLSWDHSWLPVAVSPRFDPGRTCGDEALVRFDGFNGKVLIDRKLAIVTTRKVEDQALRQSLALQQNGLTGMWEVPTAFQAARARALLEKLGIENITVRVVPF